MNVGEVLGVVAGFAYTSTTAIILVLDFQHRGWGSACLNPLPLSHRWIYRQALRVNLVSSLTWYFRDGLKPSDLLWATLVCVFWWAMKQHDHWDDDDRDSVARSLWGRVERFGNRLRVAPVT